MEVTRVVLQGNQSLTLFLGSHCDRVPLWSARTLMRGGMGNEQEALEVCVQWQSCDATGIAEMWWDTYQNWSAATDQIQAC